MPRNDVSSDRSTFERKVDFTGSFAVVLAVIGCGLFALSMPSVPDHGYQFYLARKLLGGATLYVDVAAADMHPPLFTWFATAIEVVARPFGMTGLDIYPATIVFFIAASLYALWQIGPRSPFVHMMYALALLPLSGPYMGQGEHLAILCALPYIAASVASPRALTARPVVRFLLATAAAFGLALKPYFVLVWIGTELYRANAHGRRSLVRLESVTIAVWFLVYVLATVVITPQFFGMLPWLMELYPRFGHAPIRAFVMDPRFLLLIIAVIAGRISRLEPEWQRVADILSIAAIAMYVALVVQAKAWGYHWYPVTALSVVLIGITLRPYAERVRLAIPILAVVAVFWMNRQVDRTATLLVAAPGYLGRLLELTEKHARGGPIVAFAENIHVGFPLVNYAGVEWASPYAHLWMIPAIYADSWYHGAPWHYRESGEWRELEQQMFDRLWAAIENERPSLMMVQVPLTNGFNTTAYFVTDPRFRDLFRRSTPIETVGHYIVVTVRYEN